MLAPHCAHSSLCSLLLVFTPHCTRYHYTCPSLYSLIVFHHHRARSSPCTLLMVRAPHRERSSRALLMGTPHTLSSCALFIVRGPHLARSSYCALLMLAPHRASSSRSLFIVLAPYHACSSSAPLLIIRNFFFMYVFPRLTLSVNVSGMGIMAVSAVFLLTL